MTTYRIKKWPHDFHDLWSRYDAVDLPTNDDSYLPGDILIVDEYVARRPTGRVAYANVLFRSENGYVVKVIDRHV